MTQKLLYSKVSLPKTKDDRLFSGVWLRWSALTKAEQLMCANIVFFPVWWLVGLIQQIFIILLLCIAFYEWRCYGKLRLKRPSLFVIALFAYYAYGYVDDWLIFLNAYPSIDLPPNYVHNPNELIKATMAFAVPCLVWYVQSYKIKVRLDAIAWACTISVIQMLLLWLVVQFILPGAFNPPPRTLYAFLTHKDPIYDYTFSKGAGNYLLITEKGRFRFFFDHYQTCAIFLGFVGLLALDLKNRIWSLLLFIACCFLISTTGARAVWITFAPAVFFYFFSAYLKTKGMWLCLALLAMMSYLTLSLPPVTDLVLDTFRGTEQSIANARRGSTEARSKVYQATLEKIPDKLIFGHKVEGENALQGPSTYTDDEGAPIGSHSFILGTLLYQKGLLGAVLFTTFWGALLFSMYNTRTSRPLSCFFVLLMLTLTSTVSIIHFTMITSTLMCIVIRQPTKNNWKKVKERYA